MSREPFRGRIPDDRLYDPGNDMWVMPDDDDSQNPDQVNRDPYGTGWLVSARPHDLANEMGHERAGWEG